MTLAAGTILENRYCIERLLGQGGMGAVYCAFDTHLQQTVAIKENTVAGPGAPPEVIETARKQFEREALVLARLRHPNLPRVIDHFVSPNGNQYLVMDFIEGQDLAQIVSRSGPVPEAQAFAWIVQVCSALEYLHSQQPPVIHRDIKPQNIRITPQGQVYLVDFGIAKIGGVSSKTTTGALGVTPGFSPPEQYAMGGTDARSDIYALGATFYALLTGRVPPESILLQGGEAYLLPPHQLNASVSPAVQQAILKAMDTRRTNRPQTVAEFRRMLSATGTPAAPLPAQPLERGRRPDGVALSRPSVPFGPTPQPISRPRPAVAPQPVRKTAAPILLLLIGVGLAAVVLVGLIIVAVSSALSTDQASLSTLPWDARGIAIAGKYAYIANGQYGWRSINIANPRRPSLAGSYDISGIVRNVAVVSTPTRTYAYIAAGESGLHIVDATRLVSFVYKTRNAQGVAVSGNYAYIANGDDGLDIINISNPTNPIEIGHYDTAGFAWDVTMSGNYAFIAAGYHGLYILDISQPAASTLLARYNTPGRTLGAAVAGNYVYVADGDSGLHIIDISSPASPTVIGSLDTPGEARAVAVVGAHAYVADGSGGLRVIDISDPTRPREVNSSNAPGEAWDVAIVGNYAYVATGSNGLNIVEIVRR